MALINLRHVVPKGFASTHISVINQKLERISHSYRFVSCFAQMSSVWKSINQSPPKNKTTKQSKREGKKANIHFEWEYTEEHDDDDNDDDYRIMRICSEW